MAWVAVGMGAISIISAGQQAELTRQSGEVQKQIAEMNAGLIEQDAYHATQEGETEVARYQTQIDDTVSGQRSAMAADNVDVNFGTAAETQSETKLTGYLNQLALQNQARSKAYGLVNQARNTRLTGQQQLAQSNLNASATQTAGIISGAGQIASSYEHYKSNSSKTGNSKSDVTGYGNK